MDAAASLHNEELSQVSNGVKESESPGVEFLDDLDSYWDDIEGRLTISRMVSDSVIRGMVNAIEQDAAEKIAEKDLEMAELKETLHLCHVGAEENGLSASMQFEPKSTKHGVYSSFSDVLVEHDRQRESIGCLRNSAKEQLTKLKNDIDRVRGISSIRKINSGSDLVGLGLGGILQEKVSDKWMDMDKTFDSLRTTLESIYREVDNLVNMSKGSLRHWQLEQDWQVQIEDMVITNCIRSFQEEFEGTLWEQNARFCGDESVRWVKNINEISCLHQELDAISKLLSAPDVGHLISQGSVENGEELISSKKNDHLHRKLSGSHISPSATHREGNGKHEESVISMPENFDGAQLKHLPKEDLVNYFKTEMTKMKRNHDYAVQEITEELFSLKREYLKERGSSLPLRKDKEFEVLRKKIPEFILRLDEIILQYEKLSVLYNNSESSSSLKDRLDFLLSENRQLRDLLAERKKEVNCLSSQLSDVAEKVLRYSVAEGNSSKIIGNLKCGIEDAHIEASIIEDVNHCLLKEIIDQMECLIEESNVQCDIMHKINEIVLGGAVQNAATTSNYRYEDTSEVGYDGLDIESIFMEELRGVIFKEALKEVEEKLGNMNVKYLCEQKLRISSEKKAMENEEALRSEHAEKERLQQETMLLAASIEEREKLVQETAAALAKEKERVELASQELLVLRGQKSDQDVLISRSCEEMNIMKVKLDKALKESEANRLEIHELQQRLGLTMEELRKADSERAAMLLATTLEKQHMLSLIEAKEKEQRQQIESIMACVNMFSKVTADFECRVVQDFEKRSSRLKILSSQLSSLVQEAGILRRTGLRYEEKLQRRCSDLQKAEAEVDLLGDEVDTLLGLLEKIYIALDHYSPILQHYPGIIEILKLVRKELSGESCKPV